jgi:hypothetical protein
MSCPLLPSARRADSRRWIWAGCLLAISASLAHAEATERLVTQGSALAPAAGTDLRSAIPQVPDEDLRPVARFAVEARGLLPRVSARLGSLGAWGDVAMADQRFSGAAPFDDPQFDEMTRSIEHQVERATRRAVKDILLESFEFERRIDDLQGRALQADGASPGTAPARRRLGFDVGVHSGEPQVQMRYRLPAGVLKLRISTDRTVGLQFGGDRAGHARFSAGFDGDDTFHFAVRAAF